MSTFDLVMRGGTVVDGTGAEPFEADVAVKDGKIAEVGKVAGAGAEEIAAKGKLVTPGFVDIHTHYDAQATFSDRLSPSTGHGVTTVVMGNCAVGFAPCKPEQREILIKVMEGVEDIPDIVMKEGIPWSWTSFPEYLDALDKRSYDADVAAQVPHAPVRVFVMGRRGVDREPATLKDMAQMAKIVQEGIEAGALGFSTSRLLVHRLKDGSLAPTITAGWDEIRTIALAIKQIGRACCRPPTASSTWSRNSRSGARSSAKPVSGCRSASHKAPRRTRTNGSGCCRSSMPSTATASPSRGRSATGRSA
jgi:N-acyl-D-amino-acid deacylase